MKDLELQPSNRLTDVSPVTKMGTCALALQQLELPLQPSDVLLGSLQLGGCSTLAGSLLVQVVSVRLHLIICLICLPADADNLVWIC